MKDEALKICIVSDGLPPDHGGAQLRAYHYTQHLNSTGDRQAILIAWDRSVPPRRERKLPEYVYPIRLHFHKNNKGSPRLINTIIQLIEINVRLGILLFSLRDQFDLIHIINAGSLFSLMTIPYAKAINKPVILEMVSLGGDDPLTLNKRNNEHQKQLFPHRPLKYHLFVGGDAYISKSPALTRSYRQAGLADSKLYEIASFVNVNKFKPVSMQHRRQLRKMLGLDLDKHLILFVGGVRERKGIRELILAFRSVVRKCPEAKLMIIGPRQHSDIEFYQEMRRRITEYQIEEFISIIDQVIEHVNQYMQAADILVHPSKREGFCMVILEAMACGLPIVASDIPAISYSQIRHGLEGILVSTNNVDAIARSLLYLINNPHKRCELGMNARRRVLREFTSEVIDQKYMNLYRDLKAKKH